MKQLIIYVRSHFYCNGVYLMGCYKDIILPEAAV